MEKQLNPVDALKKENAKLHKEVKELKELIKSLRKTTPESTNPKVNTLFKAKLKKAGVR